MTKRRPFCVRVTHACALTLNPRSTMQKIELRSILALLSAGLIVSNGSVGSAITTASISEAVTTASVNIATGLSGGSHLGFDTFSYPGDAAMRAWQTGDKPYKWVGYYLSAPCHTDSSWEGKRD